MLELVFEICKKGFWYLFGGNVYTKGEYTGETGSGEDWAGRLAVEFRSAPDMLIFDGFRASSEATVVNF